MCYHEFLRLHTEDPCCQSCSMDKEREEVHPQPIFPNIIEMGGGCHVHIPKGHLPRGRLGASLPVLTQKTIQGTIKCWGVVVDG